MNENVNVCITPKGDKPVLHFSQFDNENVFTVTVLADDGESAAVLTGLDIEFRLRKTDSHVVTIAPESVSDNVITFKSTEQMCACCGQNIATVTLMKDDMVISTLDILVEIQRDILSGGLTSESDIRNLTSQIEQIVPEVIGDDYYNKQEVDEKIAEIPTFDPTNYYDKSDVDDLLADKADADDVYTKSEAYNKSETDDLLSVKMDNIGYSGIVDDAAIISFNTDSEAPLAIIKGKITAVQSGSGTPSPDNVRPISGFNQAVITRTGKNLFDSSVLIDQVAWNIFVLLKGEPNSKYTISSNMPNAITSYLPCYVFNSTGNPSSSNLVYSGHSITVTTNADGIIKCQQRRVSGTDSFANYEWQLEKGETATAYKPYNGQTATVNFGQTVYCGEVNVTGGKLDIDFANDRLDEKTWSYNSSRGAFNATFSGKDQTRFTEIICSCYENGGRVYSASEVASKPDKAFYTQNNSDSIFIKDSDYTDPTTWLNALGSNTICYPLATPIEITTTPVTVSSIAGDNNIYIDTGNLTEIAYFEGVEDNLIKLIKACQI